MRKTLTYSAGLIALYLTVHYSSGSRGLISAGAAGATGVIKAFQGR